MFQKKVTDFTFWNKIGVAQYGSFLPSVNFGPKISNFCNMIEHYEETKENMVYTAKNLSYILFSVSTLGISLKFCMMVGEYK